MKTFFRTTLSRFVVFIAVFIVLGFGNLVPRGFILDDYYYFEKLLPNQVKEQLEFEGRERCMQEQWAQLSSWDTVSETTSPEMVVNTDGSSTITTLPATLSSDVLQTSFTDLKVDLVDVKQSLSQQLTDQLNQLYTLMSQQAQQIASSCQGKGEEAVSASVDLKAQRATELQAQMQQLQAEMDSLYQ